MNTCPEEPSSTMSQALLEEHNADILAWIVQIDPFELGLWVETFEATYPQTIALRECSLLPESRLSRLPAELINQIGSLLRIPSDALWETWQQYKACITRKCIHRQLMSSSRGFIYRNTLNHRKITGEFHRKVFGDRRLRNPSGFRWGQALKRVHQAYGLKVQLVQEHDIKMPHTLILGLVTIPLGSRNYGRDCVDAYEWILRGAPPLGESARDVSSEAERQRVRERLMTFKKAILGVEFIGLNDDNRKRWAGSEEWNVPLLRIFTTRNRPFGTGASEQNRRQRR